MENQMMWAYFLQLSMHMWDDENTPPRYYRMPQIYHENNGTDPEVWDRVVDFLAERKYNAVVVDVGDAIQYESHPEICAPDAWSKEFLRQKLDAMRERGLEPIPKLNFSACHHTWLKEYRHILGTEKYREVCADLIREVAEAFGNPRLFHLGMDEENFPMQKFRESVIIRGEELFWKDYFSFFDAVEKNGARPWTWADYYWDHPDLFERHMPKSVLQSTCHYAYYREDPPGSRQERITKTFDDLERLGYDQVPLISSWENRKNALQTMYYCQKVISPEHLKGYLMAPWYETEAEFEYHLYDEAHLMYLARQTYYPQTLDGKQ